MVFRTKVVYHVPHQMTWYPLSAHRKLESQNYTFRTVAKLNNKLLVTSVRPSSYSARRSSAVGWHSLERPRRDD